MEHKLGIIVKDCHYGCGAAIHFDNHVISNGGRKIPLEGDNTPHNCPFSPFNEDKNSNLHDLELIERAKRPFLNSLNRRLDNYTAIDLLIREKNGGPELQ